MVELVKSSVVFNEENHTYMLGEKQLQGITGMVSKQLFPDKYKDIPDFVLKKAAEKGSLISDTYKSRESKRRYFQLFYLFAVICIFYHNSL